MKSRFITFPSLFLVVLTFCSNATFSQSAFYERKFEQLESELPTPNAYRTGSGAPGHAYWQQRADYEIKVELDEENHRITGSEVITYTNNSPDALAFLWLQLDQNMRSPDSHTYSTETHKLPDSIKFKQLKDYLGHSFEGGHQIKNIKDASGNDLPYTINKTMLRVDLHEPLQPGEVFKFSVDWVYNINDRLVMKDRGGYETFPDGNTIYSIAQWFPRMASYLDYQGWQHKQYLGSGEFTLPFGDYKVEITVPADHLVASTGELQNKEQVLTDKELKLFEEAREASNPRVIVSLKEVEKKEESRSKEKKTWIYHAENVRDFAWASSRKFIWDAMGVEIGGKKVMAMSYYSKDAKPIYEKYSTKVVAHTLKNYSKYTLDYPYPVAISVEAANAMEYPMICFNYGRANKDGSYSEATKNATISVIIHEVGHNFFPMIVNSNERNWTWMDEGINSFLQYLTEQEWYPGHPSRRGPPFKISGYMKSNKDSQRPIMTNPEQITLLGYNAYGKPATALNILRETVMGKELFDFAFKEYVRRWAFKHPTPADFFRTMEDASAVDLDWFWKGWFYTVDHVDIAIHDVRYFSINTQTPQSSSASSSKKKKRDTFALEKEHSESQQIEDLFVSDSGIKLSQNDIREYKEYLAALSSSEKQKLSPVQYFYEVTFKNLGGLVMPIVVEFTFEDGTKDVQKIPAEVWRMNEKQATKVFVKAKRVIKIALDPRKETADAESSNNYWETEFPKKAEDSK